MVGFQAWATVLVEVAAQTLSHSGSNFLKTWPKIEIPEFKKMP
jgi:hypothetical protein